MSDEEESDDKSHLTFDQRVAGISTTAGNIADKIEDMSNWTGGWEPPEEGPKSNTVEMELTDKEIQAIARGLKSKALDHYQRRGYSPTYCKYKYLYEKFSGNELRWHEDDPKFLKFRRERESQ